MKALTLSEATMKAKTLKLRCNVFEEFNAELVDEEGRLVSEVEDEHIPPWFPSDEYDMAITLEIDIATGRIVNWTPPTAEQLNKTFDIDDAA